ncbi:MAG: hypothetical protein MZV63_15475 [Marinilabiliales bacterium]|nr:hypothetical protein [Marinilabiliales bacterium]
MLAIEESLLKFEKDSAFVELESKAPQVFEKKFIKTVSLSDGILIEVKEGLSKEEQSEGSC